MLNPRQVLEKNIYIRLVSNFQIRYSSFFFFTNFEQFSALRDKDEQHVVTCVW